MVSHTTDSIWSLFSFIFSTILNIKRFKALFDRSQKCWDGIWNWRSENPSPQCVQITSCVCTVYWSNDQWLDNGNIGEVNPMYATLYVLQQVTDFLLTFSCDDLRHCFHLVLEHCIFCSFYLFIFFYLYLRQVSRSRNKAALLLLGRNQVLWRHRSADQVAVYISPGCGAGRSLRLLYKLW